MTNFPVSHARDARQFVEFARATAGGPLSRAARHRCGWCGCSACARRCACSGTCCAAGGAPSASVATETYWSRGALRWGPTLAVRYLLRPGARHAAGAEPAEDRPRTTCRTEAARRLASARRALRAVRPALPTTRDTPIEDTGVEWSEQRVAARAGRRADDPARATVARSTRIAQAPRRSTPWPSTRGTPPTSSGRWATSTAPARRPTTPAPPHRLGHRWRDRAAACATWSLGAGARDGFSARSTASCPGTGCRCGSGCSTSRRSAHVLRDAEPDRHRGPRGAADGRGRCRRPRRPRSRALARTVDGTRQRPLRAGDGRRRRHLRPQPRARLPARTCSTSPTRSWSAEQLLDPRAVHPGALAEHARRGLDPVPGARLGQPRRATRSARTT